MLRGPRTDDCGVAVRDPSAAERPTWAERLTASLQGGEGGPRRTRASPVERRRRAARAAGRRQKLGAKDRCLQGPRRRYADATESYALRFAAWNGVDKNHAVYVIVHYFILICIKSIPLSQQL